MQRLRSIIACTAFPAVFLGAVVWTAILLGDGIAPEQTILPPLVASYLLIAVLERFFPHHTSWLHSNGDLRVDLVHLFVSGFLMAPLLQIPVTIASVAVANALAAQLGGTLWPTTWPLWFQLPLAMVVGEFFLYWIHRLTHEMDFLWRFHATHHSAPRLYFLNAVRFHPIDLAFSMMAPLVPLILLGADERIIALHAVATSVHGLFQHANLPTRIGPLNWIFSMAELHRWHHSPVLAESNTNYGQNLIVWDIVFGTRFFPEDREPPEAIGLYRLDAFPEDYLGQFLSPFRWKSIVTRSQNGADSTGASAP